MTFRNFSNVLKRGSKTCSGCSTNPAILAGCEATKQGLVLLKFTLRIGEIGCLCPDGGRDEGRRGSAIGLAQKRDD